METKAYRLQPLVRLTGGIESGLLPTPAAVEYGSSNNGSNAGRPSTGKPSLNTMARQNLWPTPTGRDYKDGSAKSCRNVPANGLLGRVAVEGTTSGALNPQFVEWLLGFPIEWTA